MKKQEKSHEEKQKKERKPLTPGKKKGMIASGIIVAVLLVIVVVVKTVFFGGNASDENVLYADSVGMLTGTGLGTQNRFSGEVEAQDTMKLTLSENEKIKEIFVEKGQEVKKGTKLFEYDTEDLSMTLEQAELELEKIDNNISSMNSQIAALNKEKKEAPSSEQLSYTTQIQELQMNIKQEEYNYKVKELEVNRTKKSLKSSVVTSTVDGIIQEINEEPGYDDYTGEKQAFMSILSTGKYRIKGKISEQNIGNLSPGTEVTVRSRVDEEEVWKGVVDSIDTEKPESSQSSMYSDSGNGSQATKYPFYVTLDTSDGLMLGQHVYVEPSSGMEEADGMWLMSAYIVDAESNSPYVWAVGEKDKLEKREIKLGEKNEEMDTWKILDGLKATDYIVWPSEDCKKGASVVKNSGSISGGMSMDGMDLNEGGMEETGMDGMSDEEMNGTQEQIPEENGASAETEGEPVEDAGMEGE